jgi:hypothetical protein
MHYLKNILQRFPLFLLTMPLFLVVHVEKEYHHLIEYAFVYKEILWLFLVPAACMAVGLLLFRHLNKAAIFSAVLSVLFYLGGDLMNWLRPEPPHPLLRRYLLVWCFLFLFIILLIFLLKKQRSPLYKTTSFLNVLILLFLLVDGLALLFIPAQKQDMGDARKILSRSYQPCSQCTKPDIYYFVFDAYASHNALEADFGFNNPLDTYLLSKQFYIANQSYGNYSCTPLSIASTLNLQLLDFQPQDSRINLKEYLQGVFSVYKNEAVPILEKEGYHKYNYSIFNMEGHPMQTAPFNIWRMESPFTRFNLLKKADADIGRPVRRKMGMEPKRDFWSSFAVSRDEQVAAMYVDVNKTIRSKETSPKFVYAHFLLPHHPYTFDSSGNKLPIENDGLSTQTLKHRYTSQLIYTNKLIKQLVSSVLSSTRKPLIIVIQGDHGSRFGEGRNTQTNFSNLSALYFSNQDYSRLYNSMSNVNTFRIIFNQYFNQQLPLLKDSVVDLY